MDGSTALAVLGLEPGATKQQIKTTFRALVKGAHPDAFGGEVDTTDAFVSLRAAYDRALIDAPADPVAPAPPATAPANVDAPVMPVAGRSRTGSWFTSARPGTRIDITDVAVANDARAANTPAANTPAANTPAANTPAANTPAANTVLRADMARPTEHPAGRRADAAEQAFASLLADELAAA